jgi:hypothetical protein
VFIYIYIYIYIYTYGTMVYETKWLDETGQEVVLDIGTEAVVEGQR